MTLVTYTQKKSDVHHLYFPVQGDSENLLVKFLCYSFGINYATWKFITKIIWIFSKNLPRSTRTSGQHITLMIISNICYMSHSLQNAFRNKRYHYSLFWEGLIIQLHPLKELTHGLLCMLTPRVTADEWLSQPHLLLLDFLCRLVIPSLLFKGNFLLYVYLSIPVLKKTDVSTTYKLYDSVEVTDPHFLHL